MTDLLNRAANAMRKKGLNILPAVRSAKRPALSWRRFQNELCDSHIDSDAICAVCGRVSGNLEVIDFDYGACRYDAWREKVVMLCPTAAQALDRCLVERSQSGGRHVAYRCEAPVERNAKLCVVDAKAPEFYGKNVLPDSEGRYPVCAIETRGEGGIIIIAPTQGYAVEQGSWLKLPVVTKEVRDAFISAAVQLSEIEFPPKDRHGSANGWGEWFAERDRFDAARYLREILGANAILVKYGWEYVETYGEDQEKWRRPGKKEGHSGLLDKKTGLFFCFSSNAAPLQPDTSYTPLQLLATLECGGDLSKAARVAYQMHIYNNAFRWFKGEEDDKPAVARPRPEDRPTPPIPESDADAEKEEEGEEDCQTPYVRSAAELVEFPAELLEPGGLLGEMMAFTKNLSRKWQPRLAFASALAGLSFHVARRVSCTETEVSPCVYALGISLPGTGKDAGRRAQRLISALSEETGVRTHDSFESVQALQNVALSQKRALLLQDEFGGFLESIATDSVSSNRARLVNEFLTLYSSYYEGCYSAKTTAGEFRPGRQTQKEYTSYPALSIYGATNPSDFRNAITERFLKNGLAARFLYVWGEAAPELLEERRDKRIPERLAQEIDAWNGFASWDDDHPEIFCIIAETEEAHAILIEFEKEINAMHSKRALGGASEGILNFMGRLGEKSRKYAGLFACSRVGADEERLKYSVEDANRAVLLARYELELFEKICESELSPTSAQLDLEETEKWVRSLKTDTFLQRDYTRKFRRMTVIERQQALQSMCEMEYVTVENVPRRRPDGTVCGYKAVYRINRAALRRTKRNGG